MTLRLQPTYVPLIVLPAPLTDALAQAFLLSMTMLIQTWVYPRAPGQGLSRWNFGVVTLFFAFAFVDWWLLVFRAERGIDFLYHLSYFKL